MKYLLAGLTLVLGGCVAYPAAPAYYGGPGYYSAPGYYAAPGYYSAPVVVAPVFGGFYYRR